MWHDEGVALKLYVSSDGDWVIPGTRVDYPFTPGGGLAGVPAGWTLSGGNSVYVNLTTSYGRWSVSAFDGLSNQYPYYGIYRRFTVPAYSKHIYSVQVQTMDGKDATQVSMNWQVVGQTWYGYSNSLSQTPWEPIQIQGLWNNTANPVDCFVELRVYTKNGSSNWGSQYTSFAITTVPIFAPAVSWHEVTCDIQGMSVRYGRERATGRYEVSSLGLSILNEDGEFSYQPYHPWGLRPGRYVKVEATYAGTTYPMYIGIIDGLTDGYSFDGHVVTNMQCVDVSSLLSNMTVPSISGSSNKHLSGWRFGILVDTMGWDSYKRYTDDGQFLQQSIKANGRTVRDELGLIADSEGATFYTDRNGWLIYRDRAWSEDRVTKVGAELLAEPEPELPLPNTDAIPNISANIPIVCTRELETSWSRDRVVNQVSLANQGGTAYTVTDGVSQQKYGPRTYERMDLLNDNAHPEYLQTRMADLMEGNAEALVRVNRVQFNPRSPEAWKWTLALWLNDLVRIRYQNAIENWGFSVVAHVQGIEMAVGLHDWQVTLNIDDYSAYNFWAEGAAGEGWDLSTWDQDIWDA